MQVGEGSQYLLFTWPGKQFTWTAMPRGLPRAPLNFSQMLKADLHGMKFPKGPTLLHYVHDLLLCLSQVHMFKLCAFKEHKVAKEKLLPAQTQARRLVPLISEQGCT